MTAAITSAQTASAALEERIRDISCRRSSPYSPHENQYFQVTVVFPDWSNIALAHRTRG
jgi:hypothetical protein